MEACRAYACKQILGLCHDVLLGLAKKFVGLAIIRVCGQSLGVKCEVEVDEMLGLMGDV